MKPTPSKKPEGPELGKQPAENATPRGLHLAAQKLPVRPCFQRKLNDIP